MSKAEVEKCWRCHKACKPEVYLRIKGCDQPFCQKCADKMTDEELNGIFEDKTAAVAANVNMPREVGNPLTKKPLKITDIEGVENFEVLKPRGKQRLVAFRISQRAEHRLKKVSRLFNLKPGAYIKALLYRDLGLYDELMDLRRKEADLSYHFLLCHFLVRQELIL